MKTTLDPKVRRIEASWMQPSRDAATWLAAAADELIVADTTLHADRFAYIGLDHGSAGLVVGPTTADAHVDCPTDVLVLRADRLAEARERIPALAN
ncbi:MAG: hypothetical protein AAGE98_02665 [Actinomycetota bacterium]